MTDSINETNHGQQKMDPRFQHLRNTMAAYMEAKKHSNALHPCFREYEAFAQAATDVAGDLLAIVDRNTNSRQQDVINAGFKYWRASDAHGVTGTKEQAELFIADLIGVEVEIRLPNPQDQSAAKPSDA
jgi:hypothetical protein